MLEEAVALVEGAAAVMLDGSVLVADICPLPPADCDIGALVTFAVNS
jgi:hypothetical protein